MPNEPIEVVRAKLRIEIICPVGNALLERTDIEELAQGKTIRCNECWDEHEVKVSAVKVKVD